MYLQGHYLFYLFLKRSYFDEKRLIFFFLINRKKNTETEQSFLVHKVQNAKPN